MLWTKKRLVCLNVYVSILTLQYIACTHASLSHVETQGLKGYGVLCFKKESEGWQDINTLRCLPTLRILCSLPLVNIPSINSKVCSLFLSSWSFITIPFETHNTFHNRFYTYRPTCEWFNYALWSFMIAFITSYTLERPSFACRS